MSDSDELRKLADLYQRGILSAEEFSRAKERLLNAGRDAYSVPPAYDRPASDGRRLHALRRSWHDRWFGGVCGGLGQFLDMPSWVWRMIFVLLFFGAGTGLAAYLLLWIFIPEERFPEAPSVSGASYG
jgi:phage shock protein PspC (stress-responsive transcriptional regulator)